MNWILPKYEGETVVILATGPSLDKSQVLKVQKARREGKCRVLTVNNAFMVAPFTDIHVACNDNWWDYYYNHPVMASINADKWTRYEHQEKYGINYIDSIVAPGLSKSKDVVHINKGSGPMAINFATLYGFKKIILLGHDMKFAKDYDGAKKKVGSTPRHFFGEYPESMRHFPQSKESVAEDGTLIGLIEAYEGMLKDLEGIDIVNCTPGTALKVFRLGDLDEEL